VCHGLNFQLSGRLAPKSLWEIDLAQHPALLPAIGSSRLGPPPERMDLER